MNLFWLLIVSVLPGLLWVYFFYSKDKYEPEPVRLILVTFFYGALAVIPVGLIEFPFSNLLANPPSMLMLLLLSVGIVGVTEEVAKFAVVRYTIYSSDEFDEVVDGIIYSVSAGLGFAVLENFLYTLVFGYQVGMIRAIVTSLIHASFSGIMGYYLGRAKLEDNSTLILVGLVQVILLHGLYDFLVLGGFISDYIVYGIVAILYIYLVRLINSAVETSPFK
ncbi:putative membrane protein [Halobacteroides halobius DSM 5150]|uniref:Protease PrsW n=1 Tax=Halobacteroides halobius (strain ATCC 35273 / DSM 5150 / MD-1) TaxID=748449 RepID=L0KA52_HALHC|nr:PrsW family glutamic-type intramembrane protease [Halobacteroides halobius]AGB42187.1 putative membrane protein [Halobacteroides halobius DSM 5150]